MKTTCLLAPVLLAACAFAHAQQPADPLTVFKQYVQAVHAADMPAVRSLIASDVERSDYPACTAQMDNAACLAFYIDQTVVRPQAQITVISAQVQGEELIAKLEVRSVLYQKAGVDRIVGSDVLRITGGKIRAFRFVPDFKDPATATFFAAIGVTPRPTHSQP
jgi:hypothetical protein